MRREVQTLSDTAMTDDEPQHPAGTRDSECLGSFPGLAAFVRATLEPLLPRELQWLLDCPDLERVLRVMTADGRDRLRVTDGRVWLDRHDGAP